MYNRNILFILAFVICHLAFQWFYFAFYLIRSTYSNCEFWFNFLLGCIFFKLYYVIFHFLDVYLILSDLGTLNQSVLVVLIHSSDLVVFLTRVRLVFVSLSFSFYLIRVICSLWSLECRSPPNHPSMI